MKCIKSLTLSITEILEIFAIERPDLREYAIGIIRAAVKNPESIDPGNYTQCDPIIRNLIQKLKHRVDLAHRRAEARARREAEKTAREAEESTPQATSQVEEATTIPASQPHSGEMSMTLKNLVVPIVKDVRCRYMDYTISAPFNWLDSCFPEFISTIEEAFYSIMEHDPKAEIVGDAARKAMCTISEFLRPYIVRARQYKDL